jgi:hypothetical protein
MYYDKTFLTQMLVSKRVRLTAGGMSVSGFDPAVKLGYASDARYTADVYYAVGVRYASVTPPLTLRLRLLQRPIVCIRPRGCLRRRVPGEEDSAYRPSFKRTTSG